VLRFDDITLSMGGEELISGINLHLRPGDRLGIVGRNGCGKTTLLGVITGRLDPDSGTLHRRNNITVGELPQDAVSGSDRPLWEEARSGLTRLLEMEVRLNRTIENLDGTDESIAKHAAAEDAFRQAGGYAMEETVGIVLHGLGFRREDWTRPCSAFSGGWQMRIALARLLLSRPDVLLLDEPTNHLDLYSRSWLAGFLERWHGAVIIVSHDRHVLDRATTAIAEVRGGRLTRFTGNFTSYLKLRELKDQELAAARAKYEAEHNKALDAVARFGAKATKSKQAHSRLARVERKAADAPPPPAREPRPRLMLKPPEGGAEEVVSVRNLSAGWDGVPVFEKVDMQVNRGERWFVLGPNGAGKSTLLRALRGTLEPIVGKRHLAHRARVGLYEQDQAKALPRESTGLEYLLLDDPFLAESRARAALGALGLSGEKALQPIGSLSGGEKARVAMAALAMKPWELLLLDEPTNHLDAMTADVLADALEAWPGALVAITHDRHLVERLATHVVVFTPDSVSIHEGVRPEDLEPRRGNTGAKSEPASESAGDGGVDYAARKRRQRERERARRRVANLEKTIEALEAKLEALDADLFREAADPTRVSAILIEREAAGVTLDETMAAWEQEAEALDADA